MLYKSAVCITDSKFVFPNNSRVLEESEVRYRSMQPPASQAERSQRLKDERCFLSALLKPRTGHLPLTPEEADRQLLSIVVPGSEEVCESESTPQDNYATRVVFSYEEALAPVEQRMTHLQVSENINALLFKLEGKTVIPYNQLTTRMRPMLEVIRGIETVNIFAFIEEAFSNFPQKELFRVDPGRLQAKLIEVEKKIVDIQQLFASMCDRLVEAKEHEPRRRKQVQQRLERLCKVLNMALEWAINRMLVHSAARVVSLLRKLLQGLSFSRTQQDRFDYFLSRRTYRLKQEGLLEAGYVPAALVCCCHPGSLFAARHSDMRRFLVFMKTLVANFCSKLREGRILSPRRVRRRGALQSQEMGRQCVPHRRQALRQPEEEREETSLRQQQEGSTRQEEAATCYLQEEALRYRRFPSRRVRRICQGGLLSNQGRPTFRC